MASEPYLADFGEAEVTLEVGGTDLEPSLALGKGKTLLEPAWMEHLYGRPHLVCFAVALRWGVRTRAGDLWDHLTFLSKLRKWLPGWNGLEKTEQPCAH